MADPDLLLREWDAFEGLTMNVEFCEDNSGNGQKMRYSGKKGGRVGPPDPDPGLATILFDHRTQSNDLCSTGFD